MSAHYPRLALFLIAVGLVIAPVPAPLRAGSPAAIDLTIGHVYSFAQEIRFTLDASGDVRLVSAVVRVTAGDIVFQPLPAQFEPGSTVHAEAALDLRGGVFPPFSTVTYWWEVTDENGQATESPRATFVYVDDRFEWRQAAREGVTAHWADGDAAFGDAVLAAALDARARINAEIDAPLPPNIDIYVYPSREDLIGALRLGGREWAGGQARPELGVVLVDIPPTVTASVETQRVIPHELTHLLVYAATQPFYDAVPTWLDEGLATANETAPDPSQVVALEAAAREGRLIPIEQLCAPFPVDADEAMLSYAQGGSLVQFIRDRYGRRGIQALLAAYRENADCAPGVQRALGVTLPALEREWRAQFSTGDQAVSAVAQASAPWLVLLMVIGLALLPMLGLARHKKMGH
jgi:hypothetical protein